MEDAIKDLYFPFLQQENKGDNLFEKIKNARGKLEINGVIGVKVDDEKMKTIADGLKLNNTLFELELPYNKIGAEGMKHLAEVLKVNSTLRRLDLLNNYIGNEGVKYLSEAMKINTTLTEIRIPFNKVTDEGGRYILDFFQFNNTLTYMMYYNANMQLELFSQIEERIRENSSFPEDARRRVEQNRRFTKIIKFTSLILAKKKKNFI